MHLGASGFGHTSTLLISQQLIAQQLLFEIPVARLSLRDSLLLLNPVVSSSAEELPASCGRRAGGSEQLEWHFWSASRTCCLTIMKAFLALQGENRGKVSRTALWWVLHLLGEMLQVLPWG